jgi:Spy/CpxP family protein refolding chaperone
MTQRYRKTAALLGAAAALSVAAVPVAQARHGADDPPNHERVHHHRHHGRHHAEDARHGKDDPAGHDRNDDRGGDR